MESTQRNSSRRWWAIDSRWIRKKKYILKEEHIDSLYYLGIRNNWNGKPALAEPVEENGVKGEGNHFWG